MLSWFKKKAPPEPDRSALVPRIKHTNFLAALREMDVPADQMPVSEPLVGDLLVTYAYDLPGLFMMASAESVDKLGIRREELRGLAIANLKKQLPEIGMAAEPPLTRIVTGNNLEACTILADTFWADVASETPGDLVAAIPHRDLLLYCSSQAPEGVEALRQIAREVSQQPDNHTLSAQLFTWRGGKWVLHNQ